MSDCERQPLRYNCTPPRIESGVSNCGCSNDPAELLQQYNEVRNDVILRKRSGPAEIAAMRIDFDAWLGTLSRRERRIAKTLAGGKTIGATARKFSVSPSRISQTRVQLKRAWEIFQGELPEAVAKREPSRPAINRSLAVVGGAV